MYLSYFYFGDDTMLIDTKTIFSMTQANQNFSSVARSVDKNGEAVVLKNNKPKYLVIDMDNEDFILDLIVAKRVLNRYLPAFKELAK